jgi:hypothetical protein
MQTFVNLVVAKMVPMIAMRSVAVNHLAQTG